MEMLQEDGGEAVQAEIIDLLEYLEAGQNSTVLGPTSEPEQLFTAGTEYILSWDFDPYSAAAPRVPNRLEDVDPSNELPPEMAQENYVASQPVDSTSGDVHVCLSCGGVFPKIGMFCPYCGIRIVT